MVVRHFPHCVPASHTRPTASTVSAPSRIASTIFVSLTARQRHTYMRR
jgi:hypothetical protein